MNIARLNLLAAMMVVAPEALRAIPDPKPPKPITGDDLARISAAEVKRQTKRRKRAALAAHKAQESTP